MARDKRKLTNAMITMLKLLTSGWEMGLSHHGRMWIQKGGAGKGGDTHPVHTATFLSLQRRGFIKRTGQETFPTQKFNITDEGRAALKEAKA